jgi:hypothetical protein
MSSALTVLAESGLADSQLGAVSQSPFAGGNARSWRAVSLKCVENLRTAPTSQPESVWDVSAECRVRDR